MSELFEIKGLELVQMAIREFHEEFIKNPYNYLCESEIQSEFSSVLKAKFQELPLKPKYLSDKYDFNRIRNEYLLDKSNSPQDSDAFNAVFDIVVLSENMIDPIYTTKKYDIDRVKNNWLLYKHKVQNAIEIKFFTEKLQIEKYINDISKFEKVKDSLISTGIALYFFQFYPPKNKFANLINRLINLGFNQIASECLIFEANRVYAILLMPKKLGNANEFQTEYYFVKDNKPNASFRNQ